jgi:hypothetical protein
MKIAKKKMIMPLQNAVAAVLYQSLGEYSPFGLTVSVYITVMTVKIGFSHILFHSPLSTMVKAVPLAT